MKTPPPKIIVLCLLMLMAIPMWMPLLYEVQKWEIRKHMFGLLKERQLQTVRLAAEDVVWMDKHEIWVNEQMFDVASAVLADGVYTFTGLYDEEETQLVKKQIMAGEEDSEQHQRLAQVLKWLHNPCIVFEPGLYTSRVCSKIFYPVIFSKVSAGFTKLTTPPPKAGPYQIS